MEEFSCLQDYLEWRCKEVQEVTSELLKIAKEEYRKMYLKNYQEAYAKKHVQISFRITKKQYEVFKNKAKIADTTVTKYIKTKVLKHHNNNANITVQLQQLLLELLDDLEEAKEEQEMVNLPELIQKLTAIQKQLS